MYNVKKIREDFPLYKIEASILKEIDSLDKINKALELYDTIVLPMNVNNNTSLLENIEQKDRITLFGNAGCALSCPNRICYDYISKRNKILRSVSSKRRLMAGRVSFTSWVSHSASE